MTGQPKTPGEGQKCELPQFSISKHIYCVVRGLPDLRWGLLTLLQTQPGGSTDQETVWSPAAAILYYLSLYLIAEGTVGVLGWAADTRVPGDF